MGFKLPSIKKKIAAQTSFKKKLSLKLPKGTGAITNREGLINRKIYDYTTVDPLKTLGKAAATNDAVFGQPAENKIACPKCNSNDTGEVSKSFFGNLLKKAAGITETHYCRKCKHTW